MVNVSIVRMVSEGVSGGLMAAFSTVGSGVDAGAGIGAGVGAGVGADAGGGAVGSGAASPFGMRNQATNPIPARINRSSRINQTMGKPPGFVGSVDPTVPSVPLVPSGRFGGSDPFGGLGAFDGSGLSLMVVDVVVGGLYPL